MQCRKGQIWSYDILAAVVVFIIMFSFLAFFWWSVATTTGEPKAEIISREAKGLSDTLLSPGSPTDWDGLVDAGDTGTWAAVASLGLTEEFGASEVSEGKAEKIALMNDTDYSLLKQKLRTNYNFYIEMKEFYNCSEPGVGAFCNARGITDADEEWLSMEHFAQANGRNVSFGTNWEEGGARSVSAVSRYALYNDSLVRIKVVLWTNQSWQ